MPFDYCPSLSTTGVSHPWLDTLQPEWVEDALYGPFQGDLDAPTFMAAGFMWQAINDTQGISSIPGMCLIDRRIA